MKLSVYKTAPASFRAWEWVALVLASAFAALVAWLSGIRHPHLPPTALLFLSLLSLLFSAALMARRPSASFFLLTFLPALPLAAAAQVLGGAGMGSQLFASLALAFQGRCLFLQIAAACQRKRLALSRELKSRLPEKAVVFVDNDIESEVELPRLFEGHLFRLAPGAVVPADGIVTFGSGFVDESFGGPEDLKLKGMGSAVLAGTTNKNGSLLVRATAVGDRTFLSRLAKRIVKGAEIRPNRLLLLDGGISLLAAFPLAFFGAFEGPAGAALPFLATSGASCAALLASFELGLARMACRHLWLWGEKGIAKLAGVGMLVLRAEGVLSEGRLRLQATESRSWLSEDAALGLLGPLARKIESPAAFALLQELRTRNIPLQQADLYQAQPDGGIGFVGTDEVRWVEQSRCTRALEYGELGPFVEEHLMAGEEVHFLERDGKLEAALAFRDSPVEGAPGAVEALRQSGLPILLVSGSPKRVVSRQQTALGVEHAQGECGDEDVERLFDRLRAEGLAPAWVQASAYRPLRAFAVAASPGSSHEAELVAGDLRLPHLAEALSWARVAGGRLRSSLFMVFGFQAGLLLTLLGADARLASRIGLGNGWPLSMGAFAALSLAPGLLALVWLRIGGTFRSDSV